MPVAGGGKSRYRFVPDETPTLLLVLNATAGLPPVV